jgi:hypothetical protein
VHGTVFRGGTETGAGRTASPETEIERLGGEEVLFVGTGALRYRPLVEDRLGPRARFLEGRRNFPDAGRVAARGAERLRIGASDPIDDLVPLYLRGAEARPAAR